MEKLGSRGALPGHHGKLNRKGRKDGAKSRKEFLCVALRDLCVLCGLFLIAGWICLVASRIQATPMGSVSHNQKQWVLENLLESL